MLSFLIVGIFVYFAVAQKYPSFFDNEDLKAMGFLNSARNPNPVVRQDEVPRPTATYMSRGVPQQGFSPYGRVPGPPPTPMRPFSPIHRGNSPLDYDVIKQVQTSYKGQSVKDINTVGADFITYDDLSLLGERLTKTGKWNEFKLEVDQMNNQYQGKPMKNWEEDAIKWAQYSRNLYDEEVQERNHPPPVSRPGRPSLGMEMYWGDSDIQKPTSLNEGQKTVERVRDRNTVGFSGKQIMDIALKKLEAQETADKLTTTSKPSDMLSQLMPNTATGKDEYRFLPRVDDFESPIRWVTFNSNETRDGLAKVTDPRTGKNRQYLIDGSILVPIIDHRIERLGWTTEKTVPLTPSSSKNNSTMLRYVMDNVDLKNVDERDWLAFETVLGGRNDEQKCRDDGCQARCNKMGCESMCSGDTCASGCVGTACNSFCKGPGCLSMCIGEDCTAKCDGQSCEARCRGKNCESSCRRFSCGFTTNGLYKKGGGTWEQLYPQYDTKQLSQQPDF